MDEIRFICWETVKVFGLVFLGLVSAKAAAALTVKKHWIKPSLYALILALAGLGAYCVGNDVAAEVYAGAANSNLDRGDMAKAYSNAIRAISLRPHNLSFWRTLREIKMRLGFYQSVLDDEPAMQAVSGGNLIEEDEYQFVVCSYYLGQYDKVLASTPRLISQYPRYASPYVLQGLAYVAEKKYRDAEKSFRAVLQIFPSNQSAVEGLARALYLEGDRQAALTVLDDTEKFPFPPDVRQRFEALKGLYDQ